MCLTLFLEYLYLKHGHKISFTQATENIVNNLVWMDTVSNDWRFLKSI